MISGILKDYDEEIHNVIHYIIILLGLSFVVQMLLYPDAYNFFDNFLSDLGRIKTFPLEYPNTYSSPLFTATVTIGGLTFMLFFIFSWYPFNLLNPGKRNWLLIIGSISGFLGGVPMILIGWYQLDVNSDRHYFFGYMFFGLLSITMICYSLYLIKHTDIKITNTIIFIILGLFLSVTAIYVNEVTGNFLYVTEVSALIFVLILIILTYLSRNFRGKAKTTDISPKLEARTNYISFILSYFALSVICLTAIFIALTGFEVKPVFEVLFVWSFLIWALVINFRGILLSYKTLKE